MKKTFSSKKSAFSLIELSIVLIIIGLLIAGVTGGASLIKSSELRSVMGEARGYAVVVNAFYTQYNGLPGDYSNALGTNAYVGDGDSKISYCASGGCSTTTGTPGYTGSEANIAWVHLKYAGAIDAAPTTMLNGGAAQVPGTNFPASKIKAAGWNFDYNSAASSLQNVVVLTGATTGATASNTLVNGTVVSTGAILPTDALAIDAKIDDGKPDTGKVRGVGGSSCYASSLYTVATGSKVCALSYQVDVNS